MTPNLRATSTGAPKLTARMRAALTDTARPGGVQRRHTGGPGKPPWPHHPASLAALLRHNLVDHEVDQDPHTGVLVERWTIRDEGMTVLHPPPVIRQAPPNYLMTGSHHTDFEVAVVTMRDGTRAMRRLPIEQMDPPNPEWADRARRRHAKALDRKVAARLTRKRAKRAA